MSVRDVFSPLLVGLFILAIPGIADAIDSRQVKTLFEHPPRQYSSAPLWVWNDDLTDEQIVSTLNDLAGQQVKQVFVHPRPGLMIPYLSPEWFRLWKVALREAKRLDMNVWIYDENSYPSGFAGGHVPEAMPESRGRGLVLREEKTPPPWTNTIVGVYRILEQGLENVTDRVRAKESFAAGRYCVATIARAANSPWHGGRSYVDLLYPGVTEKFLSITLDAYKREIGHEFGRRVPGVFTDEPNIRPAGGLPWTDSLPADFEQRRGYRLTDHLPSLQLEVGDWQRVRHDYYQTLLELFIERWGKPYHDYCATNRLEFTGHYWDHDWPSCLGVPDNMAMYAWHQRPAIDVLMNQYREAVNSQFGNVRIVKELSSVANQLGQARTLCEAYGAGGWDLRFEDMKRIGDWLYVLGVNTLDEHLSYITLRGARKRDHPQSFSYHEPWWTAYHVSAAYFSRLSAALSQGQQVNPVLVLEPTTTAWMYNTDGKPDARLDELGESFQKLLQSLESTQIEYDIGCEDIMARHGAAANGALQVGQRNYAIVVLPPRTETLNARTVGLLEAFLQSGGAVLCAGNAPARVDGMLSDRLATASQNPRWRTLSAEAIPAELAGLLPPAALSITRSPDDKGVLFHHRRQLSDGQLLFLVNTSLRFSSTGVIESKTRGLEQWDPDTGLAGPYPFAATTNGTRFAYDLAPAGSLLLFLADKPSRPSPIVARNTQSIPPLGPPKIERAGPNVLALDYVDITVGGLTQKGLYFYRAEQLAFQKNGMARNPWDSAVQFGDELISKRFPNTSGLDVSYKFTIRGPVPRQLAAVIERADLYTVTFNGQPLAQRSPDWWLDKSFHRLDLTGRARPGENVLRLQTAPFTILNEIEPVYLLGDFALEPSPKGFVLGPDKPLDLGPWNEQGHPFLSAGAAYSERFVVTPNTGRFRVAVRSWHGSVAKVTVNGQLAGYLAHQPWECEVTPWIRSGTNTVTVEVIGTLKNTLGPHHFGPGVGSAWPGMFQTGPESGPPPGSEYATIGYGLFAPFVLNHDSEPASDRAGKNQRPKAKVSILERGSTRLLR